MANHNSNTKHGQCRGGNSRAYNQWAKMKSRCVNVNDPAYHHYGGRGIKVCERWLEFANFLADVGTRPSPEHSLDRYPDPNGNYEPGNVRWATRTEQGRNRSDSIRVTLNGQTKLLVEWVEELNLNYAGVYFRIRRGMSPEVALTKPFQIKKRRTCAPTPD